MNAYDLMTCFVFFFCNTRTTTFYYVPGAYIPCISRGLCAQCNYKMLFLPHSIMLYNTHDTRTCMHHAWRVASIRQGYAGVLPAPSPEITSATWQALLQPPPPPRRVTAFLISQIFDVTCTRGACQIKSIICSLNLPNRS